MKYTKSNETPKDGKKNIFSQYLEMWKKDVNWDKQCSRERKICIWFILSFCAVLVFGYTWLFIPSIISLVWSITKLKHLEVEE